MININRRDEAPASLDIPEIRLYIQDAIQYMEDPENNVKPDKPIGYRNSDILQAFDEDFYKKCYLTEIRHETSWIMDIEHFIPQNERADLVYEWTNLFPADHYSNMIKPRRTPEGGYLNPCEPNDNVEEDILYSLSVYGYDPRFEPAIENQKVTNTCNLLNRVHNGHDNNTIHATIELRHAIHRKYITILNTIIEWRRHQDGSQEKAQARRQLEDLLSRRSSFTMLCRSIPAVRQSLDETFFD